MRSVRAMAPGYARRGISWTGARPAADRSRGWSSAPFERLDPRLRCHAALTFLVQVGISLGSTGDAFWQTRSQLELATVEWVGRYNHSRLHSSLGYVPPAEYETLRRPGRDESPSIIITRET
ncbi:MAG: integrase core domain-containing protein [Solirubrobacteraceae bacterium]